MNAHDTTAELTIEVRNLRSGQVIEMTVVGPWTAAAVAARLDRIITVRQPSHVHLRLPAADDGVDLPSFDRARELLAEVGGTLLVERLELPPVDPTAAASPPP